jgi:Holliday junction resolvase|tara:strand:- start:212 stop:526 length:315 start_codon:yes stop_codon:yes gene_type:complete
LPGVPDVLLCDEKGNFHLVELKFCNGNKVGLRPHQVSFLTRHQHSSSWILVKHQKINSKDYRILLFKAEEAVNLVMDGLKGSTPVAEFQGPFVDWDGLFRVLAP